MACIICNNDRYTFLNKKQKTDYVRCSKCGHICLEQVFREKFDQSGNIEPPSQHLISEIKKEWDFSEIKANYVYLPRLKKISKLTQKGRLLDIGCANGSFVHSAQEDGWDGYGLEISEEYAQEARKKDIKVFIGPLNKQKIDHNSISAITMWQVIEHLADPKNLVENIFQLLKPGGIAAISTPNSKSIAYKILGTNWAPFAPKAHFHLFDIAGVKSLCEGAGFACRRIEAIDIQPTTIKQIRRQIKGKGSRVGSNTMGKLVEASSSTKLKLLFQLRSIINLPLKMLGWGEDIYGYFQKL